MPSKCIHCGLPVFSAGVLHDSCAPAYVRIAMQNAEQESRATAERERVEAAARLKKRLSNRRKAMKLCPTCGKEHGTNKKVCECGFVFIIKPRRLSD
jgi:hypothetical protein